MVGVWARRSRRADRASSKRRWPVDGSPRAVKAERSPRRVISPPLRSIPPPSRPAPVDVYASIRPRPAAPRRRRRTEGTHSAGGVGRVPARGRSAPARSASMRARRAPSAMHWGRRPDLHQAGTRPSPGARRRRSAPPAAASGAASAPEAARPDPVRRPRPAPDQPRHPLMPGRRVRRRPGVQGVTIMKGGGRKAVATA